MVAVSVIIPAYNEEAYINRCLSSLSQQSLRDFEIIVVDDGSTDKTREIVRSHRGVRLVEGEHKGPGFSRNLAAKIAKGNILVFVDADMWFDEDYLTNLTSPLFQEETKKEQPLIGTTHDREIATNTDKWVSALWGKDRVTPASAPDVKIFRAIRKEWFLAHGGFNPKYGYADDQTFWYQEGVRPFVAEQTRCYHRNPETLKESFKQARWIGASWPERFLFLRVPFLNHLLLSLFSLLTPILSLIRSIGGGRPEIPFRKRYAFFQSKFRGYRLGAKECILRGENTR